MEDIEEDLGEQPGTGDQQDLNITGEIEEEMEQVKDQESLDLHLNTSSEYDENENPGDQNVTESNDYKSGEKDGTEKNDEDNTSDEEKDWGNYPLGYEDWENQITKWKLEHQVYMIHFK